MSTRLTARVTGLITQFRQRVQLRPDAGTGANIPPVRSVPDRSSETPDSNLYHCSECASVYIALEKDTCSRCNVTVKQVPATLSTQ